MNFANSRGEHLGSWQYLRRAVYSPPLRFRECGVQILGATLIAAIDIFGFELGDPAPKTRSDTGRHTEPGP